MMNYDTIKRVIEIIDILAAHAGGDAGIEDTLGKETADELEVCLGFLEQEKRRQLFARI